MFLFQSQHLLLFVRSIYILKSSNRKYMSEFLNKELKNKLLNALNSLQDTFLLFIGLKVLRDLLLSDYIHRTFKQLI